MTTKIELSNGVDVWVVRSGRDSLREVLSVYLGEAANRIEIVIGEHGKPRLAQGGLEFNLSHSGGVALIAVSPTRPVGVDVEKLKPGRDFLPLAERAFSPEDSAKVREAPADERAAVFYRHWVRHEARLKCLGAGLSGSAPSAPVEVQDLDVGPGYAAAVAVG
jgi:4'-phosphopantetheinyl transferase